MQTPADCISSVLLNWNLNDSRTSDTLGIVIAVIKQKMHEMTTDQSAKAVTIVY